MKLQKYSIVFILSLLLTSCEERTGYYDNFQSERISLLTGASWHLYYEDRFDSEPVEYESTGSICSFNTDGKGVYKLIYDEEDLENGSRVLYFNWTFTNDNFSVIYLGGKLEQFWLIDKLTESELWIHRAAQDPAIYPNTDQTICKFRAVK